MFYLDTCHMKAFLLPCLTCLILAMSSCSTFLKFSPSNSTEKIAEGGWSATLNETGTTHNLKNIILKFSPDGKVLAICPTCEVRGYWSENENTNHFLFSFEPNEDLCQLNKNWDIESYSSSAVILKATDSKGPISLTLHIK